MHSCGHQASDCQGRKNDDFGFEAGAMAKLSWKTKTPISQSTVNIYSFQNYFGYVWKMIIDWVIPELVIFAAKKNWRDVGLLSGGYDTMFFFFQFQSMNPSQTHPQIHSCILFGKCVCVNAEV